MRELLTVVLMAASVGILYPKMARAEPVYQAVTGNVRRVLHDDACTLKEITNLPRRATWTEGGATFEGCWGARPEQGVVLAYFTDKTVAAIPISVFVKVLGA